MTSAEWAKAFRQGDSESVARVLVEAMKVAFDEVHSACGCQYPLLDEMTPNERRGFTRTVEVLRERGVLIVPKEEDLPA